MWKEIQYEFLVGRDLLSIDTLKEKHLEAFKLPIRYKYNMDITSGLYTPKVILYERQLWEQPGVMFGWLLCAFTRRKNCNLTKERDRMGVPWGLTLAPARLFFDLDG